MGQQLILSVHLREETTFSNFFPGKNEQLLAYLQGLNTLIGYHRFVYLWGNEGIGKSHLLQATSIQRLDAGHASTYLSLSEKALKPDVLEGLETRSLVCIDDIDSVIRDQTWEEALFHFYNRIRELHGHLLVAAKVSPMQMPCHLPDLRSRLTWGVSYQIQDLEDDEKRQVLQKRANQRGFRLPDDVTRFLFKRCSRDMTSLYEILDQLDQASLSHHRVLTIPFVKEVLKV
jgi:DnaA family protein